MAHAYRTSARIEAPADVVWRVLADVESMPTWTTAVRRATILGREDEIAVGSRVEVERPGLPATVWEVDTVTPGQGFAWSSSTPGVRTGQAHLIAPLPEGACEVTFVVAQSGMLAGLTDIAVGTRSRELVQTELTELRKESESRLG